MYYLNLTDGYNPFGSDDQNTIKYKWEDFNFKLESAVDVPRIVVTIKLEYAEELFALEVATNTIKRDVLEANIVLFAPCLDVKGGLVAEQIVAERINSLNFDQVASHHIELTGIQKLIPVAFNAEGRVSDFIGDYFGDLVSRGINQVLIPRDEINDRIDVIAAQHEIDVITVYRNREGNFFTEDENHVDREFGFLTAKYITYNDFDILVNNFGNEMVPFILHAEPTFDIPEGMVVRTTDSGVISVNNANFNIKNTLEDEVHEEEPVPEQLIPDLPDIEVARERVIQAMVGEDNQ